MFDIALNFGKRLQEFRKNENLSQAQLAELIDVDARTISRIESGEQFPKPENMAKIAEVLNVSIDRFFKQDDDAENPLPIEELDTEFATFESRLNYYKVEIGKNIRKYRTEKGLSQERLAKLAEIAAQTLSGVETGATNASFNLMIRIVHVLEIPLAYIFTFDENIYSIADKELLYLATKAFKDLNFRERKIAFKLIDTFKNSKV